MQNPYSRKAFLEVTSKARLIARFNLTNPRGSLGKNLEHPEKKQQWREMFIF